jgi:isopentenyldiphosphate isomerase
MEILDVVDAWGVPTGETVEREKAHALGYRHRTAHVWLIRNMDTASEILLQKRSDHKDSHPGCYDISSAGHIPAGVDYTDSAVRELKEELGVDITPEKLIFCGQCYDRHESIFYGKPFIDDQVSNVYLVICPDEWDEASFKLQAEEVSAVLWMDFEACRTAVGNGSMKHCIRLNELEILREKIRELNRFYETQKSSDAAPVCAACAGHCCRSLGCMLSSADLLHFLGRSTSSRENVLAVLQREPLAIDRFADGRGYFYYLRMRHKYFTFIGVDAMGECAALSENGCTLSYDKRPYGGRMLEAMPDRHCVQHYTREELMGDWMPYQNILRSIWEEYEPKFEADGTFDACEERYQEYLRGRKQ